MAVDGFKRRCKLLDLISDEEVKAIHHTSVDILKETGVKFNSEWALNFFKKNDCIVNREEMVVKFPEGLVEECIRKAPSTYRVKAREEKHDMIYNINTVYYQDAPAQFTIDLDTWKTRPPTKEEYVNYIKVLDALSTVHGLSCYPYFGCADVSPVMIMPELMAIKFKYTSKFHECPYSNDSEIFCIKMAQVAGTEILGAISVASPLSWHESAVSQARRFIEAGFPVGPCSGATFAATASATIPGAIAKTNAELISMLILVQLLSPGHRCLMWELDFPQNTKTGAPAFGQIGASIGNAIFNQMWRYYEIPTANATPGFINDKTPSFQSGYERGIGTLISALSGCSLVQLHGCIMGELSGHPVQAVLDDDIAGMIGRFIEGEQVNGETLAASLIREVGAAPGHYMGKAHTRNWWKKEQFVPKYADRTATYKDWEDGGRKNALDIAKEKTKEILETHEPAVLDEEKSSEVDRILKEARNYYKDKGMI